MSEQPTPVESKTDKVKKSRGRKVLDIVIGLAILAICVVLAMALWNQLTIKHEVKNARVVTDEIMKDVKAQNGADVRAAGDKIFQDQNSAANLTAQFKAASKLTAVTPVVERTTVTNEDGQQAVSIIYKFPGKQVFYIRTIVIKPKGAEKFQLVNIKGDTTTKPLLNNSY